MREKISFKVVDKNGADVTSEKDWFIDAEGCLYFETEDVDCPLQEAEGYTYEITTK